MNITKVGVIGLVLLATAPANGQPPQLTAGAAAVAAGTILTLSASASYPEVPSAVGWSVTLPDGWIFLATTGSDAPQVTPQEGATGILEWAYTKVPAGCVRFSFTVRAPGKPGRAELPARLFLRVDGRQQQVEAIPATVTVVP